MLKSEKMNFKYLLLLFLFIFNFTATVAADSSHIDLPSNSHEEASHSEHIADNSSDDSKEHCSDHDCCHQNHIHYYLMPLGQLNIKASSMEYKFPDHTLSHISLYAVIIKPPLV